MKTYMLWHGGSSYAAPDYSDLEEFDSLKSARESFADRLFDSHFPCVSDDEPLEGGPEGWLFFGKKPEDNGQLYPDAIIAFGPRGGVTVSSA